MTETERDTICTDIRRTTHTDRYKHTERDICTDREKGTKIQKDRNAERERERELNEIKFITDLSQFLLFRHFF